jgi:hypothetical protein
MAFANNLDSTFQTDSSYFNNFYGPQFDVPQGVNEAIVGFFEQVAANKDCATKLAGAVIYTAMVQKIDPMSILQQLSTLPSGQLNNYLTLFLNLNRVGTSYLGLSNAPITNQYISRSILP